MAHDLIVEKVEKYNFIKLRCSEGHYITDWNEGDDIKDFFYCIVLCCPADTDLSKYHCITKEEGDRLQAMRDEAERELLTQNEQQEILDVEE